MNIYGFKVQELISIVVLLNLPFIIVHDWFFYLFSILVYGYAGFYIYQKVNKKVIDVNGRGVFITGCDTGFGFGLAKVLDGMGFTVFAGCLLGDGDGAQTLKSSTTGRMHVIQLDVTKDKSVEDALKFVKKTIAEKKCGFWAVVNNAGIQVYGEVEFLSMDVYHKGAEVNLFGLVRCTKAFLPLIRQNKGRIINVTSVQGRIGLPFQAGYAITKYGGEAFSDILRLEMRKFGVKVVIVEPGNFAGITGISSPENLARAKKEIDGMWEAADTEVQTTYGKDYYDTLYKAIEGSSPYGYPTLDPVNEAFIDALTNENPEYRYLVDGAKAMVDKVCILARLNSYLPTCVMDILRERFFLGHMPKINSLQK